MEPTTPEQPSTNPTQHPEHKSHKLTLILSVIFVIAVGAGSYLLLQRDKDSSTNSISNNTSKQITNFAECAAAGNPIMESFPEQCSANGQTFVNDSQASPDVTDNGFSTRVESGLKAFSMIVPDGWEVIKPLDQDSFYVMGLQQSNNLIGVDPKIEEIESFGTDAPAVFSAVLLDEYDSSYIQGTSETFSVNKNADNITAEKFTYIYEEDQPEPEAIGQQRFAGDRDYTYVLNLPNGKVIIVFYAVYGVDPSNNVELVDQIVNSISLQ